jgi:hypothetical protein
MLALPVGPAACGSDDEPRAAPEPPQLTLPRTDREPERTAPAATTPQPPPTPPPAADPDYQNAPAPPPPQRPDSPENDTPPPPGSPAERFEQECERNPEACG